MNVPAPDSTPYRDSVVIASLPTSGRGEPLPIENLWLMADQHGADAMYRPLSKLLISLRMKPDDWQSHGDLSGRQKGKNHIATKQRLELLKTLKLAEDKMNGKYWRLGHAAFPHHGINP